MTIDERQKQPKDKKVFDQTFEEIFGVKKSTNGGWQPPPLPEDTELLEKQTVLENNQQNHEV